MRAGRSIARRHRRPVRAEMGAKPGKPVVFYNAIAIDKLLQLIKTASREFPKKDLKISINDIVFEVKEPGISTSFRGIIDRVFNRFFKSASTRMDN
jgi:hypothetical protein